MKNTGNNHEKSMRIWILITAVGVILAALALFFIFHFPFPASGPLAVSVSTSSPSAATPDAVAAIASYQYTQTYVDPTYGFSFQYPDGFTVTTVPSSGEGQGDTILVESEDKKVGIQMILSPYGSDVDITAALVQADIPNMKVSDPQTVEIGMSRRGLAFRSDNPAFGGQSREVWFVFEGTLYQISTYAAYDEFLKGLFGTWKFVK